MKNLCIIIAALLIGGCGGGGSADVAPTVRYEPTIPVVAQDTLETATGQQAKTLQKPKPQPVVAAPDDEDEVPNPYGITDEPWVWHDGQFIPESKVPVDPAEPEPSPFDVYLPWGYHGSPRLTEFGPWDDAQTVMVDLSHASFGVTMVHGQYVPWMRGGLPTTTVYANSDIRRTYDEYGYWTAQYSDFRWRGSLVGFTPAGKAVTGRATLSDFDFGGENHRGHLQWDPGKAYLELTHLAHDDGTTWGDGDLQYEVGIGRTFHGGRRLHDNSFSHPFRRFDCARHVAGCSNDHSLLVAAGVRPEGYWSTDTGEVRGMFFGPNHENMAGTLQRDDLTAAFGGTR